MYLEIIVNAFGLICWLISACTSTCECQWCRSVACERASYRHLRVCACFSTYLLFNSHLNLDLIGCIIMGMYGGQITKCMHLIINIWNDGISLCLATPSAHQYQRIKIYRTQSSFILEHCHILSTVAMLAHAAIVTTCLSYPSASHSQQSNESAFMWITTNH